MQRRAHARYNVGFGAEVHIERGVISAGTTDVSRGGCKLRSARAIPEDATVRIDLCLTVDGIQEADFPRLSVMGHIQWTAEGQDEHGVVHVAGVRFESMSAADGARLEKILVQFGTPVEEHPPAPAEVEVDIDMDM